MSTIFPRGAVYLILAVMLGACAGNSRIIVDGHEVDGKQWDTASAKIRSRAAFEFSCAEDGLTLVLLDAGHVSAGGYTSMSPLAKNIGVSGCGKRGVYILMPGTSEYVLDSVSEIE